MRSKESTIIKFLIENKNEELNILKISKSLKMDYKNIYSIINLTSPFEHSLNY